jgi:hypothetical protein
MSTMNDPSTIDWTDPDNYFRCTTCGAWDDVQVFLDIGPHNWIGCRACQTARYWGYNLTSAWRDQTNADQARAMIELSAYSVAPEHEHAMAECEASLRSLGLFKPEE